MDNPIPSIPTSESAAQPFKVVANIFADMLTKSEPLTPHKIQPVMNEHFGHNEWIWRDAYDACEVATSLFLIKWMPALKAKTTNSLDMLRLMQKIEKMLPSQTWRSPEQDNFQQFSTPVPFAWLANHVAGIDEKSLVLEPSAGTGALAIHAHIAGATLQLNELSKQRRDILQLLFPNIVVNKHHGAYIHAHQQNLSEPNTILMNPPFSSDINRIGKRTCKETISHFQAAFYRLKENGRAVIITGGGMTHEKLIEGIDMAAPRLTIRINGKVYQKQGLNIETALHVIDKSPKINDGLTHCADNLEEALECIQSIPRTDSPQYTPNIVSDAQEEQSDEQNPQLFQLPDAVPVEITYSEQVLASSNAEPVAYEANPVPVHSIAGTGIFQPWQKGAITVPGAAPHPTTLAEAVAMASIRPPMPEYQPMLSRKLIDDGILSDAQLETIIHAGNAHSKILPQEFHFEEDKGHEITRKYDPRIDEIGGFFFRQGYFLGDGTGAGKGRQVAGIMMDNFNQGRRKALWLSKSDKLVEDAKRDWIALGGSPNDIIPLNKYKRGQAINVPTGILFATYATLRSTGKEDKISRMDQIINWLGKDFDGCIIFDEAHALSNATGGEKTARGVKTPSQQGIAGLALQNLLPDARVVYVSATGASSINSLGYATRLGLWSQPGFPFPYRTNFVQAMNAGGVAAAEIVARDLKALGLYTSRSLSYEGVEIDILNTPLVEEQRNIYDKWAEAFQIIHKNLQKALESTKTVSSTGATLNKNAKSAARSAFEGTKQRFFNHLITGMKCPQLFKAIDEDIENGNSVIIQIVSTGEAIMERALERIHPSEWNDLSIDITPRDGILDYLNNAFPVQMQVAYTDEEGKERSKPLYDDDDNPVYDPEALAARDEMIKSLIMLPPLPSALDQLIWHYGKDKIAEITGRKRRIIRHPDGRMAVENIPSSSGLTEAQAYMNDEKQILIFSEAGGTGRSYHADANVKNQRRRVHYLLETGWRADSAIQGLGRSNRTGQVCPPIFRPVTTDVKGEKRFIATIARRLDTLGAITRGQRATANQGFFKEEDNLESSYAKAALSQFYRDLHHDKIEAINMVKFEEITGLSLTSEGSLKQELPPMHTFLNRLLALPLGTQNALFAELEGRIASRIETAKENGSYELGVETINADHISVNSVEEVQGGIKICQLKMKYKLNPKSVADLQIIENTAFNPKWCKNEQSDLCALVINTVSLFNDDGSITSRVELIRPDRNERISIQELQNSHWKEVSIDEFTKGWEAQIKDLPEFRESYLNLITGILLPIWDKLPRETPRVRRLTTDDGEVLLGRVLNDDQLSDLRGELGLEVKQPDPGDLYRSLMNGGGPYRLASDMRLIMKKIYGETKIEILSNIIHIQLSKLEEMGCLVEIKEYSMRVFVPNAAALKKVIEKWPLV